MKKATVKERLKTADEMINKIFATLGGEKVLELTLAGIKDDLAYFDTQIADEQNFANENKFGAYKSAGDDARKTVKHMKKVRQEQVKLVKMYEQFIKQRNKIKKMW